MKWIEQFVDDLLNLTEAELFEKYDNSIPHGICIQDVLMLIKNLSAEQKLVQKTWGMKGCDIVFNLVRSDTGYEVFQTDRGGKHWVKRYSSIDDAIFDKLDRIFNAMMYSATDSKINHKTP